MKIFNEQVIDYHHKYRSHQDSYNWHINHNSQQLKHWINQLLEVVAVLIQQTLKIVGIWNQTLSNQKQQYLFEKAIVLHCIILIVSPEMILNEILLHFYNMIFINLITNRCTKCYCIISKSNTYSKRLSIIVTINNFYCTYITSNTLSLW